MCGAGCAPCFASMMRKGFDMTYTRVIPRDLFNEANLLKCLGRLWILLDETRGHVAKLGEEEQMPGVGFDIWQDDASGQIYCSNVPFTVRGQRFDLMRPLNSRNQWPLYMIDPMGEHEEISVFTEDGWLTSDFSKFIMGLTV